MTPFEVVYGRAPPSLRRFLPGECRTAAVAEFLGSRDSLLSHLKNNLSKAQQQMVTQANKGRREVAFEVGDQVFLKVRPYRQSSLAVKSHHKLAAKFYGPFVVEERVGPTAYRLVLPDSSRIHPVFHVSQLRRVVGQHPVQGDLPDTLEVPLGVVFEPEAVLAWRNMRERENDVEQVLVKWVGQAEDDATWLNVEDFRQQFPYFNLEDKVASKGEGIDMEQGEEEPRPLIVYRRRPRI